MAEGTGGKEHRWGFNDLLRFGLFLNLCASILGWVLLFVLPVWAASVLYPVFLAGWDKVLGTNWKTLEWLTLEWSTVALKCFAEAVLIVFCVAWFIVVSVAFLLFLRSKMTDKKSDAESSGESGKGEAPVNDASFVKIQDVVSTQSASDPKSSAPSSADAEKRSLEQERKEAEKVRREKIAKARRDFEVRVSALKDGIPKRYELNVAGGTVDFSDKFKAQGLVVTMKGAASRAYLVWDAEALTVTVNDPRAFYRDKKAQFAFEISDPIFAADQDVKDENWTCPLEVVLEATYPSAAQQFFDWSSKTPAVVRLDNAKQGQSVDYDIKAILGYDPRWAVWLSADGLGALQADKEGHRLKGEPTVGSDARIRVVFACEGSDRIRHELDLLLTCIMDPELRWRQIESEDSDKEPVVQEDEKLKFAGMAEAICSAANDSGARKPDPLFSKPHRVSRRQRSEDFDLSYASIRGRSHVRRGSFREDDVEARFFLDGKAVAIVVSDGAGSAPLSRRGSSIVSKVGIKSLIELGNELVAVPSSLSGRSEQAVAGFSKVVGLIRDQIEFEAECIREKRPEFLAKEMYATFLAVLVLPSESGHVMLSYSAGDGAIGLGLAGDVTGMRCAPDHGQSAGQTLFVLNKGAEDADKRLIYTKLPDSYAVLLMSDGVSDPRFEAGGDAKPESWDQLARELQPLVKEEPLNHDGERIETYSERGSLCRWLDSYEKGHHDDRTIAVLFHKLT